MRGGGRDVAKSAKSPPPASPSSCGGGYEAPLLATASEENAEFQPPRARFRGLLDTWWDRSRLILCMLLLLFSSVFNSVFFKRMTSAMPNYGWFLTQLSTIIYLPFFAILAGSSLRSKAGMDLIKSFACMGIFDGTAGLFMMLGGVHTSGNSQVILAQAVIPMTMVFSMVFLRKGYHCLQHLGATVIVCGICLGKLMFHAKGSDQESGTDIPIFNTIFVLATVPTAISSVYKEVAFRNFDGDLDVNVLQFWVTVFQFITNFCGMPVYSLQVLGPLHVPVGKMPALTSGGARCLFFFEDQITNNCGMPDQKPCDHCATAWTAVLMYLIFNILYNVSTMLVIKHGSATLCLLVSTLRLPLSAIAFSSSIVMGSEAVQPGLPDLISLLVILFGLGSYRVGFKLKGAAPGDGDGPPTSPSRSFLQSPRSSVSRWRFMPLFSTVTPGFADPPLVAIHLPRPQPRSPERIRHDLIRRLGTASPLHSPSLRHLSPRVPPLPEMCLPDSSGTLVGDVEGDSDKEQPFGMTGLPSGRAVADHT